MRLRTFAIMAVVIVLGAFGLSVWAQSLSTVTFNYVQQLGDLPPNESLYDVNFDRYAWATWEGDLLLVDAKTPFRREIPTMILPLATMDAILPCRSVSK